MSLPTAVSFTLEGEPVLVLPPPPAGQDPKPVPTFGPEWGGGFTVRLPTLGDRFAINAKTHAYFEQLGVRDPMGLDEGTFGARRALMFFEVLATEKPAWCRLENDHPEAMLACVRAMQVAEERIAAAKKKPAGSGAAT